MTNQKTNIEELNYRFIKELLNDSIYKTFIKLHYEKTGNYDFNYDAWCKSLFKNKDKNKYYLAVSLGMHSELFENVGKDDLDYKFWDMPYSKGTFDIDIINIKELKDCILSDWLFMTFKDAEYKY